MITITTVHRPPGVVGIFKRRNGKIYKSNMSEVPVFSDDVLPDEGWWIRDLSLEMVAGPNPGDEAFFVASLQVHHQELRRISGEPVTVRYRIGDDGEWKCWPCSRRTDNSEFQQRTKANSAQIIKAFRQSGRNPPIILHADAPDHGFHDSCALPEHPVNWAAMRNAVNLYLKMKFGDL